jgi:hypothetical protein
MADPSIASVELRAQGFVHLGGRYADKAAAWALAREIFASAAHRDPIARDMPPLEIVGEFTVPPVGAVRRNFQALHIDFGLPIDGCQAVDVARFSALHIDSGRLPSTAFTRIVPLRALLGQRAWPSRSDLLTRLRSYQGGGHAGSSYIEGILARLVEAADGCRSLPSTGEPGFLCGMEFTSLPDEKVHFAQHGLDLDSVERRILLRAGEVLLFDNLAIAHGRAGKRQPEELHQLCIGYRALDIPGQQAVLHSVLDAFARADK